jgi:hypothetical protein
VTGGSILWYIQKEPDLAIKLLFNRGWWYFWGATLSGFALTTPFLRYGTSSNGRVRMRSVLRPHLSMVVILPWVVLRMVASSLSFTFRCFTRTLLSYDHGASSNIARGCGRFLLPTFVASLSIPCLTDDGHPLYVSGGLPVLDRTSFDALLYPSVPHGHRNLHIQRGSGRFLLETFVLLLFMPSLRVWPSSCIGRGCGELDGSCETILFHALQRWHPLYVVRDVPDLGTLNALSPFSCE